MLLTRVSVPGKILQSKERVGDKGSGLGADQYYEDCSDNNRYKKGMLFMLSN